MSVGPCNGLQDRMWVRLMQRVQRTGNCNNCNRRPQNKFA
jgi:hypothetical protein